MELWAVPLVFLIESIAGIATVVLFLKRHSAFAEARVKLAESLKSRFGEGLLERYVRDLAIGQASAFQKSKELRLYVKVFVSMAIGSLATYLLVWAVNPMVILRTVFGAFAIMPFIYYTSIVIAKEIDENRILRFESVTARKLLSLQEGESVELPMETPCSVQLRNGQLVVMP